MNPRMKRYFVHRMVRDRIRSRREDAAMQQQERDRAKQWRAAEYQKLLSLCSGPNERELRERLQRELAALDAESGE